MIDTLSPTGIVRGVFPEHDKMAALTGENQIVGDFIEWLGANGYTIARNDAYGDLEWCGKGRDDLIASHFGVDRKAFDAEKDRMLEEFREDSARRWSQ